VRELAPEFSGGVGERRLHEEVRTAITQLEGSVPYEALPELVTRLVTHRVRVSRLGEP
jgi:hypothetical protein